MPVLMNKFVISELRIEIDINMKYILPCSW